MTQQSNLERLAAAVKAHRAWTGLSQLEVHAKGGPSNSTLTQIEAARPPAPSNATMKKLDVALGWPPGTARAILSGEAEDEIERRVETHRRQGALVEALAKEREAVERLQATNFSDPATALFKVSDDDLLAELRRRLRSGAIDEPLKGDKVWPRSLGVAADEDSRTIESEQGHDETP